MHFPITYAGFFAKSQIMFFLSLSFRFCQPLKNDGRGELRFREAVNDFLYKRKNRECKPSPDTGKVSTIRLTEGASVSRYIRMNNKYKWK